MGLFDGLHPGHRAVIQKAAEASPQLLPVVFTFTYDHPEESCKQDYARILTPSIKLSLLDEMGIEGILCPSFSEIRDLPPEVFFEEILLRQLSARMLCCGYDFRFGKNAAGNGELLQKLCGQAGIAFVQVPALQDHGQPISSTRIRKAVREGDMAEAKRLMGRPYAIDHTVVHGRHMGHEVFGFPTINQLYEPGDLLPRFGVYETRVHWQGAVYKGVTNVGVKPTVGGDRPSAETYILSYNGDLYGQKPLVTFRRFLRGEMKFSSFDALKNQIRKDAETVKNSPEKNF